ncbi:pentapeptide repeat-containing protein [Prosthecobacter sp.]|uniref:pentapeptide repeat-containing protein n=1 Tax=Prosthecobacter sp. TaxID=1965333 RepID=UPI003784584E
MFEAFLLKEITDLVKHGFNRLFDLKKSQAEEVQEIERVFGPLENLVPYYVIPDAQNVNPADLDEDNTGLVAKGKVFDLLDRFLAGSARFSHAFILSDAGMGKSSLLIMLKIVHLAKQKRDSEVRLMKLGLDTIDKINAIKEPQKTILLLDALDEDPEAWTSFYARLQSILIATKHFFKVIITCRTQFFPDEHEKDGRVPGQVELHGFYCSKLFLSPFSLEQVQEYLEKRFDTPEVRANAFGIVTRMNTLKFRPMLLSYVDFLLERKELIEHSYGLYESLVDEWLNRELRKGRVKDKKALFETCTFIANHLYATKARDIDYVSLQQIYASNDCARMLDDMSIEGRSLLHKTSFGSYKFAHYSILEFFVATFLAENPFPNKNSDQIVNFLSDLIRYRKHKKCKTLDLTSAGLSNCQIASADFSVATLAFADLSCSKLPNANFAGANLSNIKFDLVEARHSNFRDVTAIGSSFSGAILLEGNLENADFSDADLSAVNLTKSLLTRANFARAQLNGACLRRIKGDRICFSDALLADVDLQNAELEEVDFQKSRLTGADLCNSKLTHGNFSRASMAQCKLDGINANHGLFERCDMEGVSAENASFDGADFTAARGLNGKLLGSSFVEAKIVNAAFMMAQFNEGRLCRAIMSGSKFKGSQFIAADTTNATFEGSDLDSANFENATCVSTSFDGCVAVNASFIEVNARSATFHKSNLTKAKFNFAQLSCTNFSNAECIECNFDDSKAEDAIFEGANMQGSSFDKCRINKANFKDANLCGCRFELAIFDSAIFVNARCDSKTTWPKNFNTARAGLIGPGARATELKMAKRKLDKSEFQNASLTVCDFSNSNLSLSKFDNADLTRCDFYRANLSGCILLNAKLIQCDIRGAIFADADLTGADLTGAQFDQHTQFPLGFKHGDLKMVYMPSLTKSEHD